VPYLYERDGTNGENLPETHEYLQRVRAEVDARYPDRVLLAEANQWPEDVVAVLRRRRRVPHGVPLPVMPRMFMALARGRDADLRDPRADAADPDNCQWGSSCATTTS
jgi:maltose alpha-D-glucosyltransferase/alpha-amylase